ncbi:MAG: hypothetical protein MUP70_13510, partial [Candidatus Aminicenantes bacterium]|nr:hypothetical protein [Candidatus Aminicenantes bacterium]
DIMEKFRWLLVVFIGCFVLSATGAAASYETSPVQDIPGQRPMVIIADTFQFIPGTWADYTIFDKEKNETFRFYFAVLEKQMVKGTPCWWIEIEVEAVDTPVVVTRILAEETKNGPGELKKAIIQVAGFSPFSVPSSFLRGEDAEVGQIQQAHIIRRFEERTITHKGKTVNAYIAEVEDDEGRKMSATVRLELPPIALYSCEDETIRMTINDWGSEAGSKVEGLPIPFFLWIVEQVAAGTDDSNPKKVIKKNPF